MESIQRASQTGRMLNESAIEWVGVKFLRVTAAKKSGGRCVPPDVVCGMLLRVIGVDAFRSSW